MLKKKGNLALRCIVPIFLILLLFIGLTGYSLFDFLNGEKNDSALPISILFYTGHNPLATFWEGIENYSEWIELLEEKGAEVVEDDREPLTHDILSGYDVVIFMCPTKSFSPSELDAVATYAHGGLLAAGADTSIFANQWQETQSNHDWGFHLIHELTKATTGNVVLVLGEHVRMTGGNTAVYNQLLNPTNRPNPSIQVEASQLRDEVYHLLDEGEPRYDWSIARTVLDGFSPIYLGCVATASLSIDALAVPMVRGFQHSYADFSIATPSSSMEIGPSGKHISTNLLTSTDLHGFQATGPAVFAYVAFNRGE